MFLERVPRKKPHCSKSHSPNPKCTRKADPEFDLISPPLGGAVTQAYALCVNDLFLLGIAFSRPFSKTFPQLVIIYWGLVGSGLLRRRRCTFHHTASDFNSGKPRTCLIFFFRWEAYLDVSGLKSPFSAHCTTITASGGLIHINRTLVCSSFLFTSFIFWLFGHLNSLGKPPSPPSRQNIARRVEWIYLD